MNCEAGDEHSCFCFYNVTTKKNVQNCSSLNLHHLPEYIPNFTDWMIFENNNLKYVDSFHTNLEQTSFLNLKGNKISSITTAFVGNLSESKTLKWLDLSENKLRSLPPEIQELTNLEKIWLGGNPIHCDCEMTWMINWLNNFKEKAAGKRPMDLDQVKCHSGKTPGTPRYQLNKVDMGCYPHIWTTQQKLIVGLSVGTGTIIIAIVVSVSLYSKRARFCMYYYLKMDTIPADYENEDLEDIEYDAFFCYR